MKLAATIARYLMGLIFTIFGLNGFFHFIPQPPIPEPMAVQFFSVLAKSNYLALIFLIQLVAGLLLLSGYFIPLALTLLAPLLVNILQFHLLMNPEGIAPGALATICWIIVFMRYRNAFAGIFQAKAAPVSD